MASILDSKAPSGPIDSKWTNHKFNMKLVNPANKRKHSVIIVGTGLAGASAAASMGELGYKIKAFCMIFIVLLGKAILLNSLVIKKIPY